MTVNIKANGATHVGGLVGTGLYYYGEETVFKITNCSVKGSIDGAVTPGTVAGRAEGSTIESCTADVHHDETLVRSRSAQRPRCTKAQTSKMIFSIRAIKFAQ